MNLYTSHFLPFLKRCAPFNAPVLIACSGGPDSMALLRMMVEYRKTHSVRFGVAHVDHRWRKESADEAETLRALCREIDVPFHLKEIDPEAMQGNLEEACRRFRQTYFLQLCFDHGYGSVMLGHHLDDQAETVLKRVFEGAKLEKCGGMQEISVYETIPFWRPFLQVRKQKLIAWLNLRNFPYFIDPTNNDSSFLRSKIRGNILPEISRYFGKEVSPGLAFLGREAHALKEFMGSHIYKWLALKEKTPWGTVLDLSCQNPSHLFEARCLISELLPQASREIAYSAAENLIGGAANKCYHAGGKTLYIDRKRMFLTERLHADLPHQETSLKKCGSIGSWNYRIQSASNKRLSGWKQVLYGVLQWPVGGNFEKLRIGSPATVHCQDELNRMRRQARVPVFMKNWAPVITRENEIVQDFLSGKVEQQAAGAPLEVVLTKAMD